MSDTSIITRRLWSAVAAAALFLLLPGAAPEARAQIVLVDDFNPNNVGAMCGIGLDPVSDRLWIYECDAGDILEYAIDGTLIGSIPRPGEVSNRADLTVAPVQMAFGSTVVPRGTLFFINGESGSAEIYALNPANGDVLETVNANFGGSDVLGGSYHPLRNTFFLVQGSGDDVAEIDPETGDKLQEFGVNTGGNFAVGDLEVSPATGNLFLVHTNSPNLSEFTPDGDPVARHAVPGNIGRISGLALNCESEEAWVVETDPGLVRRLGQVPCGAPAVVTDYCAIIDFESVPGGMPSDGLVIDTQFAVTHGVAFELDGGASPVLAGVGSPTTAFQSPFGGDTPAPGSQPGMFFLTDDGALNTSAPDLIVNLSAPLDSAAGELYDIDEETVTIEARSATGQVLEQIVITKGDAGTGDGQATPWTFGRNTADVFSLRFMTERPAGDIGVGFDNLMTCVPGRIQTLAVTSSGACASDEMEFSWESVSGATEYRLDIASAPDPDRIVASVPVGTSTSYAYDTASLIEGRRYHARVAASTDGGATFDIVSNFTTGVLVDRTAPRVEPPVAQIFQESSEVRYTLFAEDAGPSVLKRIQIAATPDFISPLVDEELGTANVYTYAGEPGKTLYARYEAEDCAGNTSGFSAPVEITIPGLPDLVVQAVQAPVSAFSGQNVDIEWTVANTGDEGTDAPKWMDAVYVHDEPTFDSEAAYPLRDVRNLSYLGVGESYTNTAAFTLPRGIQGTWYIFVATDAGRKQIEADNQNNVGVSTGFPVTLAPYPDLQVIEVVASDNVFSGDEIVVSFTVENQGTAPADADSWFDSVFLSDDDVFDFDFTQGTNLNIHEEFLGTAERTEPLAPSEQYSASITLTLPDDAIGDHHLFVATDVNESSRAGSKVVESGDVYEFNQELDNWTARPIGITLTPPPDLVVTAVAPPATTLSGATIDLMWTVTNEGPGATRAESWSDVVYYSPTAEFDPETAIVLGTFSHEGVLQNDASYTGSGFVTVPDGVDGDGYFFVQTDWEGAVFEHTFDENNRAVSAQPAEVTRSAYPDITVSSAGVSSAAVTAGDQIILRYRARNSGDAPAAPWTDILYASTESEFDESTARRIAELPAESGLPVGADRTRSATVQLPTDLDGTHYFHVVADGADRIFEYPDVDGNTARSGAVTISMYPPVDLAASFVAAPTLSDAGQRVQLEIRVNNLGQGRTLASAWEDGVYLSRDPIPNHDTDILLVDVRHEGAVAGGAGYTWRPEVRIPDGLNGDYYFIAFPDVCKLKENDRCIEVEESDVNNNAAVQLVEITRPEPSDLLVTAVVAPTDLQASQPATIEWTVENAAAGVTADDTWYDAVYLSRDPSQSRGDVLLAVRERTGALAPGASYTGSLEVQIPAFASGSWFLLVQTDHRDDIYEHLAENNNVRPSAVGITLPPATDLIVTDVVAPAQGVPGQEIVISWTLENTGAHPATGVIREGVFVSEDAVWDPADHLLGVVSRTIDLQPGESLQMQGKADLGRTYAVDQNGEITNVLPGVPPGDYFAVVRTDIGGHIRETDTSNNTGVSAGTITADIPILAIGETEKNLYSTGDAVYYRIDVPTAGEDIVISLEQTAGSGGSTSLFVRRDATPTSSAFDRRASTPFETDHRIVLPDAEPGTYYVLIRADNLASPDTELSISARALEYSVTSVFPPYGGNTGTVTVRVDGSKFAEGGQIFLEDADGNRLEAFEAFFQNTTTYSARFNLRGQLTGLRHVVYVDEDGSEAILPDAFDVVPGGAGAEMYVETSYPQAVRSCRAVAVEVTIGNRGTVNANDMFLMFAANGFVLAGGPVAPCSDGIDLFDTVPSPFPETQEPVINFPGYHRGDTKTILPYWMYEVAPGEEMTFSVVIQHFVPEGTVSHSADIVFMPESPFTESGALEDVQTSAGYQVLRDAIVPVINASVATVAGKQFQDADEAEEQLNQGIFEIVKSKLPVDPQTGDISKGFVVGVLIFVSGLAIATEVPIVGFPIAGFGFVIAGIYSFGDGLSNAIENIRAACDVAFDPLSNDPGKRAGVRQSLEPSANTCSDGETAVRASVDPNDIVGPAGFGDRNWVSATQPLAYTVRFENDPNLATAPAQVVEIRHPLDETVDERTFRLGDFGFGNLTFTPPENVAYYRNRLDASDSLGVLVDVTAGIDVQAREAFWIFQSIDPATGTQPLDDPFVGLLPVNDSTGVGEGFARYRVRAVQGAATGDEITALADIVFDNNAPIETPPVTNTVDADTPSSFLDVQPVKNDSTSVRLAWSGSDVGSGIGSFNLYVSVDDGPFELQDAGIRDSTTLFVGESGHSYRYFTLATDNVGNTEALKTGGDVIPISNESFAAEDIPETFVLHQSYPNPFNPVATIPFDLPERGDVEIMVYDVIGRRVLQVQSETMAPGRHQQRVDLSGYASGVYFYELRVRSGGGVLFRDVKNFVLVK